MAPPTGTATSVQGGGGGGACGGNGDLVNVGGTVTASAGGVGYILTTVVPNPENLFF